MPLSFADRTSFSEKISDVNTVGWIASDLSPPTHAIQTMRAQTYETLGSACAFSRSLTAQGSLKLRSNQVVGPQCPSAAPFRTPADLCFSFFLAKSPLYSSWAHESDGSDLGQERTRARILFITHAVVAITNERGVTV